MPLPPHVLFGTEGRRRGPLARWLHRPRHEPRVQPAPSPVDAVPARTPATVTDHGTRAFWARADGAPVTSRRVAALVDAHERGRDAVPPRPRGNPAFSEALFVELMRAHQYRRAFGLLSDDCQHSWGSADRFAAAQGGGSMRRLQGVTVKDVRYLPEWTDTTRGTTYHEVAELDVEYRIGDRTPATVVPRVVHLVPGAGRWRSICHPL